MTKDRINLVLYLTHVVKDGRVNGSTVGKHGSNFFRVVLGLPMNLPG